MKRSVASLMMAAATMLGFMTAAPAVAATSSVSVTVHQGGVVSKYFERNVIKAVLDDDACGDLTKDTRHYITYYSSGCPVGNYRAVVTLRNSGGSLSKINVLFLVRKNYDVSVEQIDSGLVRITNNDAKDPIRCDYSRNGEVVYGRYIPAGGFIDIMTRDGGLKYRCYYRDGATAGEDLIAVVQLRPGAYLYAHPKSETITAGMNNTRSNVEASFQYITPGDARYTTVVQPGDFVRSEFPYQESGYYRVLALQYDGTWDQVARIYVDVHSPSDGK